MLWVTQERALVERLFQIAVAAERNLERQIIIIIINVKIIVPLSQKMLQGHCTKRYVKICS